MGLGKMEIGQQGRGETGQPWHAVGRQGSRGRAIEVPCGSRGTPWAQGLLLTGSHPLTLQTAARPQNPNPYNPPNFPNKIKVGMYCKILKTLNPEIRRKIATITQLRA